MGSHGGTLGLGSMMVLAHKLEHWCRTSKCNTLHKDGARDGTSRSMPGFRGRLGTDVKTQRLSNTEIVAFPIRVPHLPLHSRALLGTGADQRAATARLAHWFRLEQGQCAFCLMFAFNNSCRAQLI